MQDNKIIIIKIRRRFLPVPSGYDVDAELKIRYLSTASPIGELDAIKDIPA
ncbi:hypothetical protein ACTNEN_02870 [Oribacterium sp. HCP28S3_H8]|uniref:hypothetical protein n=1 Tax=Oribacterium sp. HCP28S3_H8 TaxID=3438945 RepID=UPI003F8C1023